MEPMALVIKDFMQMFHLPPAMRPYINLVATPQEMELVVRLGGQAMTPDEIAELMAMSREEAGALLAQAFRREIVHRAVQAGVTTFAAATFYDRMDIWTSFETPSWTSLPGWVRNAVSEWQLAAWIELWTPALEVITRDPDAYVPMKNRDVLLLHEACELVEAAQYICLLPCPCRTTLFPDSPVVEGSMRLGERARITLERGQGRQLTVEEAKAHLVVCDRAGLVHTGPREWRKHDPHLEWVSHGNCHPRYSFPMRAGMRLGLVKQYPRVHYRAMVDWSRCNHCGVCIARCPFDAFYHDGAVIWVRGEKMRQIKFNVEQCWGCGLCANTCLGGAITMEPLRA